MQRLDTISKQKYFVCIQVSPTFHKELASILVEKLVSVGLHRIKSGNRRGQTEGGSPKSCATHGVYLEAGVETPPIDKLAN